ncbi:ATP-dependent helicase HrpB [bacterium]|nr:ATP-dependent helicase HrpB [bacterium]
MPTTFQLPILAYTDAIRDAIQDHGRLILSAPPGTGKSTQAPQILLPETGTAIVLQPRRIAARNLAMRVAAERGESVGETVGYQVRFEKARKDTTRLLFMTYGVFWQQLLQDPTLPGTSLVILDEFHERTLEADACLAWLRRLQRTTRPDLSLVVMSATLEGDALSAFLDHPPFIEIDAKPHPVDISYQPPQPQEPVWNQAVRGFRHLLANGLDGSALVFMPGVREIRRTAEALEPVCRSVGYRVLELSGAESPEAQQRALSAPANEPCVIVATNIAETSLTIPGVTAVIDSGQSRQAAYDHERDLDTLHLGWISRHSATQRAGRAGRLGPGRCLRLWAKSLESSMPEAFAPEIERLDLNRLALSCAALPGTPEWLTPPPDERWQRAEARLKTLKALESGGGITPLGRRLLRYPIPPALARVLLASQEAGYSSLTAAMIALIEGADRRSLSDEGDLYLLGLSLVREPQGRQWGREVQDTYRQLRQLAKPSEADEAVSMARHPFDSKAEQERRRAVTRCWLEAFPDRLAFRQDKAFHLADGRKGMVSAGDPKAPLLLALELHEVGGGQQNRRVSIPLYLPCEADWIDGEGEPSVVCTWDANRQRVVQERHWMLGGLTLRKEPLPPDEWDREQGEALIVERLVSGEVKLANLDEDVEQLILRIRLAAKTWPDAGIPVLEDEDWLLLYHELIRGKSSPQDVSKEAIIELLREYVGWEGMFRIDREAPRTFKLPSGRNARITYFEDAPPELSARLGDMLGLQGTMRLYEERVQVLFDILAPNYRTVQKTFDMSGFWANTYPEVKKELKRRYPKHPWP